MIKIVLKFGSTQRVKDRVEKAIALGQADPAGGDFLIDLLRDCGIEVHGYAPETRVQEADF